MGTTTTASYATTPRTTLKRRAVRGSYDRAAVHAVLDEGLVCHVAFVHEGTPVVLPTAYARDGESLLLHGSPSNRMFRTLASGAPACVTVTLVDALVLARSAFHHSMNYRSVVAFGSGTKVTDADEVARALAAVVEHVVPGRAPFVRPPSREEALGTLVVRFPLVEVSLKQRRGGPIDEEADYGLDVWAGLVPLPVVPGTPVDDPAAPRPLPAPAHAREYRRRAAA